MRNSLRLNVDTPLGAVEVEGIESTVLAENLELVDDLVSCSVVPSGQLWARRSRKVRSAPP